VSLPNSPAEGDVLPSFLYRQVFSPEAHTLAKIHEECFPNYWDSNAFTNFFGVENTRALLVEIQTASAAGEVMLPVAMMVFRVVHEHSDIITIAVRPQWRRMGLARELMGRAMTHARTLGANVMFLDVEETNQPAIVLYQELGFKQINRRKSYYKQKDGSYTDALVMQRAFG
jgi:[ribosomal protein S18]-alanine N-acetyltransferase